jgi:hypothetical protein
MNRETFLQNARDFGYADAYANAFPQWADKINRLPEHLHGGLVRYIVLGIEPGHFLSAVMKNDLFGAVGRADSGNVEIIPAICKFLYNYAPSSCFGSKEKFDAWLDKGGYLPGVDE